MLASLGRRRNIALALIAFAFALAGAASALAALSQGKYSVKLQDYGVASATYGGGSVFCAKGKRLVSGGTFWHTSTSAKPVPDAGVITNSTPTTDGKSWGSKAGESFE